MMSLIGIPIGLYGYLFPGNINIMMLDLYRNKKFKLLVCALITMLVFETIYCIGTLQFLQKINTNVIFFTTIEICSFFMTFIMGMWMLFEKNIAQKKVKNSNILRGFISIVFHPQQIPFWIIMAVIIKPYLNNYEQHPMALFALSNAIGALLAMVIYIKIGSKIIDFYGINTNSINKCVAIIYLGMSFLIGIKLIA